MSKKYNKEDVRHLKIFLLKEDIDCVESIFKSPSSLSNLKIENVGILYYTKSFSKTPLWLNLFHSLSLEEKKKLFNSSTRAVLIVESNERKFALTFGYGRFLMIDSIVDSRFGLKTTLNLVNKDSIRSIDKIAIGSVPLHSREQLSRVGTARDFGINFDEDLVSAVTGISKETKFGKTISGSDVLAVSIPCELEDIKNFLSECLIKSNSEEYKNNFPWIDQVQEIRDKEKINRLNDEVIKEIKDRQFDKTWLAVPEIINWGDVEGFRYKDDKGADIFDDICLDDFLKTVRDINNLSSSYIKSRKIYCIKSSNDSITIDWSVFQCLYSEIDLDDEKYILTNKNWYKVNKNYVEKINSSYKSVTKSSISFPDYEIEKYSGKGKHKGEQGYNKDFCEMDKENRMLMDRDNVFYGGGHSQVEFCDIITKNKKMIYVKRYGGSSSLSHLFQQGFVSGELFRQDEQFRKEVNDKLEKNFKLQDISAPPQQDEYEIVFVIISHSDHELNLPFFSKITLQAAVRRLGGFGYKVSIKKVKSVFTANEL